MSLQDWVKNGWLKEHTSSRQEISDLLGLVARDLKACQTEKLPLDWRFTIAYNAALQVATSALRVRCSFRLSCRRVINTQLTRLPVKALLETVQEIAARGGVFLLLPQLLFNQGDIALAKCNLVFGSNPCKHLTGTLKIIKGLFKLS